eukprot:TRINITY_DN47779_c0_g1_i5.p1 TRINITY_DN47779_c0_g1~~TRINITY_DN47779_c0_g1_i5.p1  ORF type:complete len:181 (+),score=34.80 TRINITY_DN47779_c0_g1_i5:186-728(+)
MSHQKALRMVATHPTADWALILEDDVSEVASNLDAAIASVLEKVPNDWDAILLGYHRKEGRLVDIQPGTTADVDVHRMISHEYGLFAWLVRKDVARLIVDNAFPISGQVDKAITSWLVHSRFRSYRVEATSMLFYSPKSEESKDSDIQAMGSIEKLVADHGSVDAYNGILTVERERFQGD